jgi:DNA-binding LacI/PurR family transcriptional regulator
MPAPPRRVTLRDIAAAAGVHFTTVSLALRNHPRLPRETCVRLQALAEKLGYVPDPMLASLANYRSNLRPAGYQATLAWVTAHPTRHGWRDWPIFGEHYAGAESRAAALGYRLEEFWLGEPGLSAARAAQILQSRGITGLLIAPQPRAGATLELPWERFSAITIGYSLAQPQLHMACAHQYRCIRLALHELALRGYRRPGLVMLRSSDERVDHNWLAGLLVEQFAGIAIAPPLLLEAWDEAAFAAWLRRHQPDALVSKCVEVEAALLRLGRAVPRDIGVGFLTDTHPGDKHSGVDENPRQIGAAAVDFLIGMLHRNERGAPEHPHRLLIEGTWIEGRTVRPRPAAQQIEPAPRRRAAARRR